jgi:hypothetical protein
MFQMIREVLNLHLFVAKYEFTREKRAVFSDAMNGYRLINYQHLVSN